MIDLIANEFERARYCALTDRIWKHQEFDDFWVICPIGGGYDIDVLQEDIYNNLVGLRKEYPASDKSTSLLILQKLENNTQKNYQRVIDDENNIFYFKKYVIQFTEAEWDAAKRLITADFNGLGDLLMQTEAFEHVKQNEQSPYHLLYTIAHKLPFVMMNVEKKEYDPNPVISISDELQPVFAWIEGLPDMAGKNATEAEILSAHDVIDQWINANNHEQHQN